MAVECCSELSSAVLQQVRCAGLRCRCLALRADSGAPCGRRTEDNWALRAKRTPGALQWVRCIITSTWLHQSALVLELDR
jgi:hypothetical protein